MKKVFLILISGIMLLPMSVKADEGLWFLMFIERLNHRDMQKMGLQLTADEIYSVNHQSLKDAVIQFNGVCSAEIISKDGLVLTNQHCGYEEIVSASTPENNILKDGFWAKNHSEEKSTSNLFVRFFVRMGNCTERILSLIKPEMTEVERLKTVNKEMALIEKENNTDGKYTVSVKSFFQGNEYYYFVYQDYKDIRLVGVPPENMAQFGGEVDNWEWPRHTADFSLYRIYADQNGEPAPYSSENVPLAAKRFLPVSLKGVKEGDFTMVMGYPGRTNRWMPSGGITQNEKFVYPVTIEVLKSTLYYMRKYMDISEENRLIYATKYSEFENLLKNREGMVKGLLKDKTSTTRVVLESNFDAWANAPDNKQKYGEVLPNINVYYSLTNLKIRHDNYLNLMLRTSAFASISTTLGKKFDNYLKADPSKRIDLLTEINEEVDKMYKELIVPAEKDILTAQLKLYATKSIGYKIAPMVEKLALEHNNDFTEYVNNAFDNSLFTSKVRIKAFLENPSQDVLENDPLYILSDNLNTHLKLKSDEITAAQQKFTKAFRTMVEGLRVSKISAINYPDANGTIRLSYGKIRALPLDPINDAKTNNYTTFDGQMRKYIKGGKDFQLPPKIVDLYYKKAKSKYTDKDGTLHVNFLTDNDISGGSSGSPVLNAKGELIGIAFDGNIEAMAGDVIFDDKLQRTISVDIRYVLWVIENLSGATTIIDEMSFVK
jgi:hypothetical protein